MTPPKEIIVRWRVSILRSSPPCASAVASPWSSAVVCVSASLAFESAMRGSSFNTWLGTASVRPAPETTTIREPRNHRIPGSHIAWRASVLRLPSHTVPCIVWFLFIEPIFIESVIECDSMGSVGERHAKKADYAQAWFPWNIHGAAGRGGNAVRPCGVDSRR